MAQRVGFDSSAIEAVRYDQNEQISDIERREEHSYRYMYAGICLSRSIERGVGRGVWNAVKDQFEDVNRIEESNCGRRQRLVALGRSCLVGDRSLRRSFPNSCRFSAVYIVAARFSARVGDATKQNARWD